MRRSVSLRVAVYVAALLVFTIVYASFIKQGPFDADKSLEDLPSKPLKDVGGDVAYVHLEDIIPVAEGEDAPAEILFKNIMNQKPFSPVVVFSKSYCGFSRAAKQLLLEEYSLTPPPRIIELDQHRQGAELQDYIASVTGRRTVPNVIVLKESYGGASDLIALHEQGQLAEKLTEWGKGHLKVHAKSG